MNSLMNSKEKTIVKGKMPRGIAWFVCLILMGWLAGVEGCKQATKTSEENNATEQTEAKPVENAVTKTEEASEVPAASKILSDSDHIEEMSSDNLLGKDEEHKVAEKIENVLAQGKELTSIYIPLTKSLFSASDASIDAFQNRITRVGPPVRGKVYYQGENGLIESFISLDDKGVMHEILFSYDPAGNPVDELEIGLLVPDSPEKKYATVLVNKLSVFELTIVEASGKRQERVTEYFISPQLQFKKGKTFTKLG